MKLDLPDLKHEIDLWKKGYLVIGMDEVGRGAFAGPLYVGGVVFEPTTSKERLANLLSCGINDSKKLKHSQRKVLTKIIQKEAIAWHISQVEVGKINRIGIGKATFVAMRDVVKNLREKLTDRIEIGVSRSGGPPSSARRKQSERGRRTGVRRDRTPEMPENLEQEKLKEIPDPVRNDKKIFVLIDKFYVKHMAGIGLKNQRGIVHGDCISLSIAAASIIAKEARDSHMRTLSRKFPDYNWGNNKGYGTKFHQLAIRNSGPTRLHRKAFIRFLFKSS